MDTKDLSGFLVLYLISGLVLLGIPVPLVFSVAGINAICQIILDMRFLVGDPYEMTVSRILVCESVSLLLFGVGHYIFFKYVFVFISVPSLMTVAAKSALDMFVGHDALQVHSEDFLLRHFETTRLVIIIAKRFIGQQSLYTIVISQIYLTIAAWLCINCHKIIPWFVIATMAAGFVGCFGLAVFLLTMIAKLGTLSRRIIEGKRTQFGSKIHGMQTRNKYLSLKWTAQQPLPLSCGPHFAIDQDAVMNYVNVLMDNISNAVLLILR